MPSFSRNEIVLVRYPFSDLSSSKVRPAVVVSGDHLSNDIIIAAMTSRTTGLQPGEFALSDWPGAGLNVETAVKRAVLTIHQKLVLKRIGKLSDQDAELLDTSLREWLVL